MNTNNDKIRVLHLIHSLEMGGAQKVIVHLVRGMDKSHFDLTTTCLRKKGPIYDEIKALGCKVNQVSKKYKIDPGLIFRLKKHIIEGEYHILHTHNFSAGLWGRLAALLIDRSKRPILVHTEHGRLGEVEPWRKMIVRALAPRTDMIIAVSNETRDYLLKKVELPSEHLTVIRNGIDIEYLQSKREQRVDVIDEIKKKDPYARFIVNVSALSPIKDHATLIRAFEILHKKLPAVHLLLVGDGPLRLELKRLASSLHVDNNIHFLGERLDVPAILSKCEIFVLSSLNEGNPISLLEAMGMGVVPVTTATGGLPEILENTVNGLLVAPSEPSLLADALRVPLEFPHLAKEWSERAKQLIHAEYTTKVMSKKHEDLYLSLLKK